MLNLNNFKMNEIEKLRNEMEFKHYFQNKGINLTEEEIIELKEYFNDTKRDKNKLTYQQLSAIAGGIRVGEHFTTPEHFRLLFKIMLATDVNRTAEPSPAKRTCFMSSIIESLNKASVAEDHFTYRNREDQEITIDDRDVQALIISAANNTEGDDTSIQALKGKYEKLDEHNPELLKETDVGSIKNMFNAIYQQNDLAEDLIKHIGEQLTELQSHGIELRKDGKFYVDGKEITVLRYDVETQSYKYNEQLTDSKQVAHSTSAAAIMPVHKESPSGTSGAPGQGTYVPILPNPVDNAELFHSNLPGYDAMVPVPVIPVPPSKPLPFTNPFGMEMRHDEMGDGLYSSTDFTGKPLFDYNSGEFFNSTDPFGLSPNESSIVGMGMPPEVGDHSGSFLEPDPVFQSSITGVPMELTRESSQVFQEMPNLILTLPEASGEPRVLPGESGRSYPAFDETSMLPGEGINAGSFSEPDTVSQSSLTGDPIELTTESSQNFQGMPDLMLTLPEASGDPMGLTGVSDHQSSFSTSCTFPPCSSSSSDTHSLVSSSRVDPQEWDRDLSGKASSPETEGQVTLKSKVETISDRSLVPEAVRSKLPKETTEIEKIELTKYNTGGITILTLYKCKINDQKYKYLSKEGELAFTSDGKGHVLKFNGNMVRNIMLGLEPDFDYLIRIGEVTFAAKKLGPRAGRITYPIVGDQFKTLDYEGNHLYTFNEEGHCVEITKNGARKIFIYFRNNKGEQILEETYYGRKIQFIKIAAANNIFAVKIPFGGISVEGIEGKQCAKAKENFAIIHAVLSSTSSCKRILTADEKGKVRQILEGRQQSNTVDEPEEVMTDGDIGSSSLAAAPGAAASSQPVAPLPATEVEKVELPEKIQVEARSLPENTTFYRLIDTYIAINPEEKYVTKIFDAEKIMEVMSPFVTKSETKSLSIGDIVFTVECIANGSHQLTYPVGENKYQVLYKVRNKNADIAFEFNGEGKFTQIFDHGAVRFAQVKFIVGQHLREIAAYYVGGELHHIKCIQINQTSAIIPIAHDGKKDSVSIPHVQLEPGSAAKLFTCVSYSGRNKSFSQYSQSFHNYRLDKNEINAIKKILEAYPDLTEFYIDNWYIHNIIREEKLLRFDGQYTPDYKTFTEDETYTIDLTKSTEGETSAEETAMTD